MVKPGCGIVRLAWKGGGVAGEASNCFGKDSRDTGGGSRSQFEYKGGDEQDDDYDDERR